MNLLEELKKLIGLVNPGTPPSRPPLEERLKSALADFKKENKGKTWADLTKD